MQTPSQEGVAVYDTVLELYFFHTKYTGTPSSTNPNPGNTSAVCK
jgi:hypothetical protein